MSHLSRCGNEPTLLLLWPAWKTARPLLHRGDVVRLRLGRCIAAATVAATAAVATIAPAAAVSIPPAAALCLTARSAVLLEAVAVAAAAALVALGGTWGHAMLG